MKDKVKYKGKYVVRAFIDVSIFVGNFSIVTNFAVVGNIDDYRDKDIGVVIVGKPFCRDACVKARWLDRFITIHKGMRVLKQDDWMDSLPFTKIHRGLKQGDPLAPYLFILVMESLHLSFSRVVESGLFKGISIDNTVTMSHLFYADDAIFIGEWSEDNLNRILQLRLRCSVMTTPFKYLGVMVGGNMSRINAWDDSIHKLKTRLSKWKLKTLSIGGWLTLLKSVLVASPIYAMSLFKVPKSVLFAMESIRRNFFTVHKAKGIDLVSHCKKRVGNGLLTRFWSDTWVGDTQLCHMFPRLYALELSKDICMADKLQLPVDSSFRRPVRGGVESSQLEHLLEKVNSVILSNSCDRWYWDLNGNGVFCVKDVRRLLDDFFSS
nr:RNA-directed DNA polymerase, eukaryota [Tanacetum cinerariifolium]